MSEWQFMLRIWPPRQPTCVRTFLCHGQQRVQSNPIPHQLEINSLWSIFRTTTECERWRPFRSIAFYLRFAMCFCVRAVSVCTMYVCVVECEQKEIAVCTECHSNVTQPRKYLHYLQIDLDRLCFHHVASQFDANIGCSSWECPIRRWWSYGKFSTLNSPIHVHHHFTIPKTNFYQCLEYSWNILKTNLFYTFEFSGLFHFVPSTWNARSVPVCNLQKQNTIHRSNPKTVAH